MIESQQQFLYASLVIWLLIYVFKIVITFIIDKENRSELLLGFYPLDAYDLDKPQKIYLVISAFSCIFIGFNMFSYSEILKDIYDNNFLKLFCIFCFYLVFWIYLFISSFYESLGFWGFITKLCTVLALIGYIKNSYSVFWTAMIFLLLGIPNVLTTLFNFMKLGACSGNPQARTEALMGFFIGIVNSLFTTFFMLSPIIHSKFIC